jgi:virulence-associated protein VapD
MLALATNTKGTGVTSCYCFCTALQNIPTVMSTQLSVFIRDQKVNKVQGEMTSVHVFKQLQYAHKPHFSQSADLP